MAKMELVQLGKVEPPVELEQEQSSPLVGVKKRKIAIEEEEFSKGLTDIIRRDFFPDVEKLESQIESSSDNCIPGSEAENDLQTPRPPQNDIEAGLSLDQYLNIYESEDDASFSDMLVKSRELHRQKHAWLHEKEKEYAIMGSNQKQAGLDSWTYTAKNSLMYIPDGVENSAVEMVHGTSKTKEIVHSNTRLPPQFVQKYQNASTSDCTKKPSQEKVGVDGRTLSIEESPKVNGYGFLATPLIIPGVDASPLMTWGSVEGTPVKIDSTPGPSFKMPKIPVREKIGLKLADQVAKASRERKKASSVVASPSPRENVLMTPSKSDRLRLLAPVAGKLIDQRVKNSDKALNASYSPQLSSTHASIKTPSIRSTPDHCTPSITDNLLNITK